MFLVVSAMNLVTAIFLARAARAQGRSPIVYGLCSFSQERLGVLTGGGKGTLGNLDQRPLLAVSAHSAGQAESGDANVRFRPIAVIRPLRQILVAGSLCEQALLLLCCFQAARWPRSTNLRPPAMPLCWFPARLPVSRR